jgi:CheY-like chemotaxis protein
MEHLSVVEKSGSPAVEPDGRGIQVLVVEDEAIIAMDILGMLKKLGCVDSEAVSSGEESVRKVAARRPHLVLMDVRLKGAMDGIQAGKQIFYDYNVPVVYLTAFGDESTIKRANGTARFGFLTKPFEEYELQSTIISALVKAYF